MREVLVIVNYMRNNPTIVDDLVIKMNNEFNKIYVINRNTNDKYSKISGLENVEIREVNKYMRTLLIPKSIVSFFRKNRIEEIIFAIKNNRFSKIFLVKLAKHIHIENLLYSVVSQIDEIKYTPEKVAMLSVWFTSEANVLSRVKKKHPDIKAVSMAHAHEVETFDNKYTFIGKKDSQSNLDKVFFIAQAKMDVYIKEVCSKLNISTRNLELKYWGSEYVEFTENSRIMNKEKKVIVSCSTVEGLKRVELIAEAVSLLKTKDIEWHHFGDGEAMDKLVNIVNNYDKKIRDRIFLHGRVDNLTVKEFYWERDVALFLNVSTSEGLPISVMEAMSYSIPSLVTDVGGEREIVDDLINGYIVPSTITALKLSEMIDDHLQLEETCLVKMKQAAREKWEEKFNIDQNILGFIEELIS